MKNKRMKTIASALVITFGLSVMPAPAMAVSTNIVAETKNVNTLTVSQIQDLAVIYNSSAEKMRLTMKQLELQEQTLRNNRRNIEDQIDAMGEMGSGDNSGMVAMQQTMAILSAQIEAGKAQQIDTTALEAQLFALQIQYQSAVASQQSMMASMQSGLDNALAGIDQINSGLDKVANGKDDLNKAMKDLESQMRYVSAQLALGIVQMDEAIKLQETSLQLMEKAVKVAELQKKLGMNIDTDVENSKTTLDDAKKGLADSKESLSNMKRSLNILIGRNAGNPLEVKPMNLPINITPAPAYTEALIKKFTDNNYKLKTMDRDIVELKDSVKDDMGSDERQDIDYQVKSKQQDVKDQKQAVSDNLKALLAKINSDGAAYKVSKQKYATEQKTFNYMQKRYQLGMISQMQLMQAEMSLRQAEMTNIQNGYAYYLDWQKYNAAEKGVDMSSF